MPCRISPRRITSQAAASTRHAPAASHQILWGRLETSPWRFGMPAKLGVVVGQRSIAAYSRGQDHPPAANDSAVSAAAPATIPPPNRHRRLPRISSGTGRNRLNLMRQRLKTHPASQCFPRKKSASEIASSIITKVVSWPMRKQFSSGALQQQAIRVTHLRGAGQNQANNNAAASEADCQI